MFLLFFIPLFPFIPLNETKFKRYVYFFSAPLGSILELPALSCQEIKASEGNYTISDKYWLDPAATGKAVLVYCDMNLEG